MLNCVVVPEEMQESWVGKGKRQKECSGRLNRREPGLLVSCSPRNIHIIYSL